MERSAAWTLRGALARMRGSLGAAGMAGAVGVAGLAGPGRRGRRGQCLRTARVQRARARGYPDKPIRGGAVPAGGGTDVLGARWRCAWAPSSSRPWWWRTWPAPPAPSVRRRWRAPRRRLHAAARHLGHARDRSPRCSRAAYAPLRDAPVARLAYGGNVLVANPGFAAHDLPGTVAMARRRAPTSPSARGAGSGGHGRRGRQHRGRHPPAPHPLQGREPHADRRDRRHLAAGDVGPDRHAAADPPARCARWPSAARSARRRCPTCPPSPRPACRSGSIAGSRCSCRRARRQPSSTSWSRPRARPCRTMACRRRSPPSACATRR